MAVQQEHEVAIEIQHLDKVFKLPHDKYTSIKSAVVNFYRRRKSYEIQQALEDISLEIHKGEFFGIVGRNGSGKSTLLKLLAGIYTPTKGKIHVNGRLTPFIELGVGFNPELTGRDNVFLNGALLGFNRKEMEAMYKDVVEFAELERFMDQKLKNYSSGMQVRLAFSIAIRANPDILVLDEVLAVGDLDFQNKCYRHFAELKKKKQTLVIVTHDMAAVRRFCDRAALINQGKLEKVGTAEEIATMYEALNLEASRPRLAKENAKRQKTIHEKIGSREAVVKTVETFDTKTSKTQDTFVPDEKIGVRIVFEAKQEVEHPAIGFIFQDQNDVTVFATNNKIGNLKTKTLVPGEKLVVEAEIDNVFTDGEYSITCAIESENFLAMYDRVQYAHKFMIGGHALSHATVHPEHKLTATYEPKKVSK